MTPQPNQYREERPAMECAANDSPPLSPFLIRIGPRGAPRLEFGALGTTAAAVFNQYVDLCEEMERCEIVPIRSAA